MRVKVTGDNDVAKALRGNLRHEGFVVDGTRPLYTINIVVDVCSSCIIVDGVDSEFERHVVDGIASLPGGSYILLHRGGATVDDRTLTISVPPDNDAAHHAVEIGVLRGLINATQPKLRRWWQVWR